MIARRAPGLILALFILMIAAAPVLGGEPETVTFAIEEYEVTGNTLMSASVIRRTLAGFTGPEETADTVEAARSALEKLYHKKGYPTVMVNIPEQTVEGGTVILSVMESTVDRVYVKDNKWFSASGILAKLPALSPGTVLYLPDIQRDLAKVNRSRYVKVTPALMPGTRPGTVDVELTVDDDPPLRGSLELSNRASHDTTDWRLNAEVGYENLWQKEHSVSFQYQTSPQDLSEVQVIAASYMLPAPWNARHLVIGYGVWSDSETAFGEGFQVIGEGMIFGGRVMMPLASVGGYSHHMTLGADYKDFNQSLAFDDDEEGVETPVTYLPLSLSYSSSFGGKGARTSLFAGLNAGLRGLVADNEEFREKRFRGRANFLYMTLGVEHERKVPPGLGIFSKLDGQLSDQPLISNEQYAAGGLNSVRGYKESEVLGDDAVHGTFELTAYGLTEGLLPLEEPSWSPVLFYDFCATRLRDPLPGQEEFDYINGAGLGFAARWGDMLETELAWAVALSTVNRTESGANRFHIRLKWKF
ncbi:MAG: ShlB/FhaC/HecB family hemolysin secretion/activation protein [Desulfatibacillaceae bacterium]